MARRHRIVQPQPLLVLLLLAAAARPCLAQQGSSTGSSSHHHSKTAGGFTPTTVIVLVVLISAFVVLTLFSIYINRCAPGRPPPRRPSRYAADRHHHHPQAAHVAVQVEPPDHRGLDRDVVESFPTAVYGDVKARAAAGSGPLECAVCLAAFDDRDDLRVLPACCHVFHPACIDPWLAAAVTCPLCRADLNAPAPLADPPASADDNGACRDAQDEEPGHDDDDDDEARLAAFTPESVMSFGATSRRHEGLQLHQYRRTQSATDARDRHTLRLPEHVMRELAAVRRHRRAASLAGYPDAAVERTPGPGWLASFWRSVSWQRTDAAEEHGHGGSKRVVPVPETPAGGRPGGGSGSSAAGAATDGKQKPDQV
ncbi:hypothetical protein BS78_01G454700 [Paspalum vaginatum]|nr:hypothetical protein BS78_01G454700 [Paspalum vaginatum]